MQCDLTSINDSCLRKPDFFPGEIEYQLKSSWIEIHHCSERERSRKNVTAHRRFKAPSSGTKRRSTVCALAVHASLLSYQAPQAARQRRDTTLAEAPSWLTFGCRDGSEGGSRGSFQSREPIGPLLGQVNGWGRVPGTGDGGDALAV